MSTGMQTPPRRAAPPHVVTVPDRDRWATFADGHPDASAFHTPDMHEVLARTPRHRPGVWAAVDGDGDMTALFTSVEIAVLGGPLRLLTTRRVAFASPLVRPGPAGLAGLAAVLAAVRRDGGRTPLFTEIRHHVDSRTQAPHLRAAGFVHEDHLNFLVDLTSTEQALWEGVASSARRAVRRAGRAGVVVCEAAGPTDIAEAYTVLRDVYRRIQVPLPDVALFQAADAILRPTGRFTMLTARLDGRTIGVVSLLSQGRTALYWYAGALRDQYASVRAADLLAWEAIRRSRAAGHEVFDFGGGGRPDEPYGVRDFKAKYGGRLVDFGRDVRTSAPVRARLATGGYALARRVLR